MESILYLIWLVLTCPFIFLLTLGWIILKLLFVIICQIIMFVIFFFKRIISDPLNILEFLRVWIYKTKNILTSTIFGVHSFFFEKFKEFYNEHSILSFVIALFLAYLYKEMFFNLKNRK